MKPVQIIPVSALILFLFGAGCATRETMAEHAEYAGSYSAGPLAIAEIGATEQYISAVPPFWQAKPYFTKGDGETFLMMLPDPAPERTLTFQRDDSGTVVGFTMSNVDGRYNGQAFTRLPPGKKTPAQLFLERRPAEAARAALADSSVSLDNLESFALQHFMRHPTYRGETATFVKTVLAERPNRGGMLAVYGYTLVALDRRQEAKEVLDQALTLDPENPIAQEGARLLAHQEPQKGQGYRAVLPFSLDDAFARPSAEEIAAVRADWEARDLSARNVEVVHEFHWTNGAVTFQARIIRHEVHGDLHYGAVYVPEGATTPLPVLLDVRGVNYSYSPLDITHGTKTMRALGSAGSGFVVVVPSLRGNSLVVGEQTFASEGDPSDAWDGATDDALALLNATLEVTPQADADRAAVVGYSRGGTVALLAGERDSRVGLVLDVAGPVDHFVAMDPPWGFRWPELLADDMRDGTAPTLEERQQSSQVFDHFFDRVLTDGEGLSEVRHRMLASSPLYFLETMPEMHAHYGPEDNAVPLANPTMLKGRLEELGMLGPDRTVTLYEGRGHDTDPYLVQRATVARLVEWARGR